MLEHSGGHLVLSRVRVVPARTLQADLDSCIKENRLDLRVESIATAVERIGVEGRSLTFRLKSDLYGCDESAGSADREKRTWCGSGFWGFPRGVPLDPRLGIGCLDRKGKLLGLGWFQPVPGARWLTVAQPGYTEAYEVAGDLPVRLMTSDVRSQDSGAVFRITQYASDGTRLAYNVIEARVAG